MKDTAPELARLSIASLILDPENARLPQPSLRRSSSLSQQAVIQSLARLNPVHFMNLARDIAERGMLDPLALPAVTRVEGPKIRYLVAEGNRRVAALKALENPALVVPELTSAQTRALKVAAEVFSRSPIGEIECRVFVSITSAEHWITTRHTGQNNGVGLVGWGSAEQDNWEDRHGRRTHFRQMMDFVEKFGDLPTSVLAGPKKIKTNLERTVKTVQSDIGLLRKKGVTYTFFPPEDTVVPLAHLISILKNETVNVNKLRSEEDRKNLIGREIPLSMLPQETRKLKESVPLDDLTFERIAIEQFFRSEADVGNDEDSGSGDEATEGSDYSNGSEAEPGSRDQDTNSGEGTGPKGSEDTSGDDNGGKNSQESEAPRATLIPKDCHLDISLPRLRHICTELRGLDLFEFPEAVSVLLRVFLELSMDEHISRKNLIPDRDGQRRATPLAKKLKTVSSDLRSEGRIDQDLHEAISKMADNDSLGASLVTFHQYVHSRFKPALPSELEKIWDVILQPFLEAVFSGGELV